MLAGRLLGRLFGHGHPEASQEQAATSESQSGQGDSMHDQTDLQQAAAQQPHAPVEVEAADQGQSSSQQAAPVEVQTTATGGHQMPAVNADGGTSPREGQQAHDGQDRHGFSQTQQAQHVHEADTVSEPQQAQHSLGRDAQVQSQQAKHEQNADAYFILQQAQHSQDTDAEVQSQQVQHEHTDLQHTQHSQQPSTAGGEQEIDVSTAMHSRMQDQAQQPEHTVRAPTEQAEDQQEPQSQPQSFAGLQP